MKTKKVLVRVTNLQVTMTMKVSVLKVRQMKWRSCRVAAPTTEAQESSRVTRTKAKKVKNAKTKNKTFMWKNCSNKKTPQVSEIRSKKSRPVNNNLSPNTPPIEFFNMFCDDNFIDAIVYQSNIYNTQRSIDDYQLPTNERSSSEKSFRSVKPV